jgi:voltage-gated potassium channel
MDGVDEPMGTGEHVTSSRAQMRRTYERFSGLPLAMLGVAFIAAYAWPILDPDIPAGSSTALGVANLTIWFVFVLDYLTRLGLAADRLRFVRRQWFDLVVIVMPMIRPLRALRSLAALRVVGRAGTTFARRDAVVGVAATLAAGGAIAALAMLEAERQSDSANIRTYGDSLWWALSTLTTVGYGDRFPTTSEGRFVAAALMLGGVALLGVVTAALASWFVERFGQAQRTEQDVLETVQALRAEIEALRHELRHDAQVSEQRHSSRTATDWRTGHSVELAQRGAEEQAA